MESLNISSIKIIFFVADENEKLLDEICKISQNESLEYWKCNSTPKDEFIEYIMNVKIDETDFLALLNILQIK